MNHQILLVRHAMPVVLPDRPPASWPLGADGMGAAANLIDRVRQLEPDLVVASSEMKAIGTATVIAAGLGLDVHHVHEFGEQGGDSIPFIEDPAMLRQTVRRHFEEPDRAVFGAESSHTAARRFATALESLGDRFPESIRPLIVSHGRIMAAFLGTVTGDPSWEIWKELAFPDLIRVDLNARRFEAVR